MKRICCLSLLFTLAFFSFAQNSRFDNPFTFSFDLAPRFDMFRPMALDNQQESQDLPLFANSPQWLKDLRRGEIIFFGTLPFTIFLTRTIIDIVRMGQHGWTDWRYAPWPLQSADAVAMNRGELIWLFSISGSASVVISVVDHLIVRHKRKAVNTNQ